MDHLYRHHYGKMVAVLVRIFGLQHLETIEDAVQDTFLKATSSWKINPPDQPEAWLTKAARNRVIDLFRKIKPMEQTMELNSGSSSYAIGELFLDDEIADSSLRMIFAACHPELDPRDQIVFSLKTISGFSNKEIAAALMLKEPTVKKRIQRARQKIQDQQIAFGIPARASIPARLQRVHQVLYLIFNEGFHANHPDLLVRQDLCSEAIRLMQMLLSRPIARSDDGYALLALMCFHASRIETKLDARGVVVDLEHQDRSKWYFPLIRLGNDCMEKAVQNDRYSRYHYEAAIAAEHLKARKFEDTDWDRIYRWQEALWQLNPSPQLQLNMAMVLIQRGLLGEAGVKLDRLQPLDLEQRAYLYYAVRAKYFEAQGRKEQARASLELALKTVGNTTEQTYLKERLNQL